MYKRQVGNGDLDSCRGFAENLAMVLDQLDTPPLLLISSDMNHFATDSENRRLDELALQAMETLDPGQLLRTVRENNISMCGVLPAVIVMETLIRRGALSQHQRTGYATSAETTGDSSRVVGYAGCCWVEFQDRPLGCIRENGNVECSANHNRPRNRDFSDERLTTSARRL